jgi:hypothetical protein
VLERRKEKKGYPNGSSLILSTPILQYSITPVFHHSNIPSLHYSNTPAFGNMRRGD